MTLEYKTNAFGDINVEFVPDKCLPDLDYEMKNHIVLWNAPAYFEDKRLPYFIGRTKLHGNIFGNKHAHNHFPVIENDMLQGGCTVMFAESSGVNYAVLVQIKKRPYVMNAAGYMNRDDTSLKDAAIREVLEETGLKIQPETWKKFAEWKFIVTFAGLSFEGYTQCGMCRIYNLPIEWTAEKKQTPVIIVPVADNDETESIVLIDVDALRSSDQLTLPTKFSGHHFNLVIQAGIQEKLLEPSCKNLMQPVSYLREFSFY